MPVEHYKRWRIPHETPHVCVAELLHTMPAQWPAPTALGEALSAWPPADSRDSEKM